MSWLLEQAPTSLPRGPKPTKRLLALLVDPSLFTAPYDAELTRGLVSNGVDVLWATRPRRPEEPQTIPAEMVEDFFYCSVERASPRRRWRLFRKGISHLGGCVRLLGLALRRRPDVIHFQWTVLPLIDVVVIRLLRLLCPVVVTVHDTTPFNGEALSLGQTCGFDLPIRHSDRVIVHLASAAKALMARGIDRNRIRIVPHGPLALSIKIPPRPDRQAGSPWTIVLFGKLKRYKGLDLLVEAAGRLPPDIRTKGRIIVAGAAFMDIKPVLKQAKALGLEDMVEFRLGHLSEIEMAKLFAETDSFVFPYRQVDSSGVYFLVNALGKWVIASRVGIFDEDVREGKSGRLVPPGDSAALATALSEAITTRPVPSGSARMRSWVEIGAMTRTIYEDVTAAP